MEDSTIKRFWAKVSVKDPDECWIWQVEPVSDGEPPSITKDNLLC